MAFAAGLPALAAPSRPALLLVLLLFAAMGACSEGNAGRRGLLARPLVGPKQCLNTMAGRWLSADDRGTVCRLEQVDSRTGCCKQGTKFSCETCLEEDNCCAEYEHCVSCCMRQDHTPPDRVQTATRVFGRPETGHWGSVFELCRGKCRTSQHSTVHENSYLGRRHHCYGERSKPLLEPQSEPLPPGVQAVAAEAPNLSCHQVCARASKRCSEEHFPGINHCDRLRDHFGCEAGCEVHTSSNRGADHPAYIIYQSSKETLPTMCILNDESQPNFNCNASHNKSRRLCPCV